MGGVGPPYTTSVTEEGRYSVFVYGGPGVPEPASGTESGWVRGRTWSWPRTPRYWVFGRSKSRRDCVGFCPEFRDSTGRVLWPEVDQSGSLERGVRVPLVGAH